MAKQEIKETVYDDGTYVVKKNRKGSIIAFIICVLIAFVIWMYAKNLEIKEASEQLPPQGGEITEQGVSPASEG